MGKDSRDRLAANYAAAKAENQRIWQLLQAELRAGTPLRELTDLETRMWAAMRRLEKASEEFYEGHCGWKTPAKDHRSG